MLTVQAPSEGQAQAAHVAATSSQIGAAASSHERVSAALERTFSRALAVVIHCRRSLSMRSRSLLPWIIAFKAFKTITLTALGIALLVTRHADPVDVLLRVAFTIHLPLTSRLFQRLLLLVADLSITKETAVALAAFAYAILMGTEGVALYLRRPWARWFTIVATSSLIPLEVYEIVREVHPMRVFILVANVAVVVYLWRRKDVFE